MLASKVLISPAVGFAVDFRTSDLDSVRSKEARPYRRMKLPVLVLCSLLGVESLYTSGPRYGRGLTAVERRMESSLDKCASYGES